jgi:hypothetical protein
MMNRIYILCQRIFLPTNHSFFPMRLFKLSIILLLCCSVQSSVAQERTIWTKEKANTWYSQQGWLIGANFIPSTAINELEMWQAESFDSLTIDRELGWAEALGMNTMRVFLHDLLYQQDPEGLYKRINIFLTIASKHHIKPLLVIFDSCWDPFPKLGTQRAPTPFVHNSGWVQSPGYDGLKDSTRYPELEKYVKGVITTFATDERVLGWDIWNEPDNLNGSSYGKVELPNKVAYVLPLLKSAFEWARAANPSQPITSGVWTGNWSSHDSMSPIAQLQMEQSDIISFHDYEKPAVFEKRIQYMQRYGRPIICTEYMARPAGSTFEGALPLAEKYNIGMYNWGFVAGKSQTIFPWDSWGKSYASEPPVWFHDIFRPDGTPYRPAETALIKRLTLKNNGSQQK